jgi:hypothetical protein
MIDKRTVQEWIERTHEEGRTAGDVERLAFLYIVLDHMDGEAYSHASGDGERLTAERAKAWVESMEGTDPDRKKGGRWSMDEAKSLAKKAGLTLDGDKLIEFYAILNAMYSDYYAVAQKYGVAAPEFFADITKAWLDDKDAKEGKAARYWKYIIKR